MQPLRLITGAWLLCALITSCASAQFSWTGSQPGALYGSAVTFLGDLDGDGAEAIAIGSPLYFGPTGLAGRVEVRQRWTGTVYTIDGEWFGDQFGSALDRIPDVDGDLIPELVVGAWGSNQGGITAGKVYVFSGASGSLIWSHVGQPGERLGFSVAHAGDTHGTGIPSVVVGAPGANGDTGAAYVLSGLDGSVLVSWTGQNVGDRFGYAVSRAGLIGGDPFEDVLVSSPWESNGNGRARAYSPKLNVLHAIVGGTPGSLFGSSLAGFDDLSGDGRNDFLVGLPAHGGTGQSTGRADIRETLNWSNQLATWSGTQNNEAFGRVVRNLGDFTGDGNSEVGCAAPTWDGPLGADQGHVLVYAPQGPPLLYIAGAAAGEQFGAALAGGGDFNGDGFMDVIVGAPKHASAALGAGVGRVALYQAPGIATYGTGLGPLNSVSLSATGSTNLNELLHVAADNGPAGQIGAFWIALNPENVSITFPGGSATLLVSLGSLWPEIPFVFDGNGSFAQTWLLLPSVTSAFSGTTLYWQAGTVDLSTGFVAASNGLSLTVGY